MPKLKDILDAFLAPWSVAAGIAIGSACLLVLRKYGIADLEALPRWVFGAVWVALIYAGVVLCIRVAQALGELARRFCRSRRRRVWIHQQLDTLSQEEHDVFAYMLGNNQRSIAIRLAAGEHFGGLIQKGLIIRASGRHNIMQWPHTIPDDVWEQLVRRRDEFVNDD